jgi:hypothetical protein
VRPARPIVVAATFTAIALTIWWPFEFSRSAVQTLPDRMVGIGRSWLPDPHDAIVNIVVFVPLGLLAAGRAQRSLVRVGILALFLSLILELGQIFQPGRTVSLADVAFNTAGALGGALLCGYGPDLLRRVARRGAHPAMVPVAGVALCVVIFAWLQNQFGALDVWSNDQTLQIGNEATGDRAWCGEVISLTLSSHNHVWTQESFEFAQRRGGKPGENPQCANEVWFQTVTPPLELVRAVRISGSVRVQVSARPTLSVQHGPARIVSISRDPNSRNITLGHEDDDLIVRIRRRWAGSNGDRPFYRIRDVFRADEPVQILVDAGSDSTIVMAGDYALTDRHDIVRQWWIPLLHAYEWHDNALEVPLALVFWAIMLGPAGAVAGAAAAGRAWSGMFTTATCGGIALTGWGLLRLTHVEVGLESLVFMPLTMAIFSDVGRRMYRAKR